MSISKQFLSEKLIEGYIKAPLSLQEQTLTKLAIQLCKYFELNFKTFCPPKSVFHLNDDFTSVLEIIAKASSDLAKKVRLPSVLLTPLSSHIRSIAFQVISWNLKCQMLFNSTKWIKDQYLLSSDWTVEGRLNERKVAERLVQVDRIPVIQRYKIACVYFLQPFIHSLWDQISFEHKEELCNVCHLSDFGSLSLIGLWSWHLNLEMHVSDIFWKQGFKIAAENGEVSAVVYCYEALSPNGKQEIIRTHTKINMPRYNLDSWFECIFDHEKWYAPPSNYSDILYFLYAEMSLVQRRKLLEIVESDYQPFYLFFIAPNVAYFTLIITMTWDIWPETIYGQILLILADMYANDFNVIEYKNYDYGSLLLELIKSSPDSYKRYLFRDNSCGNTKENEAKKILQKCIRKHPFQCRNIRLIQKILQYATVDEKKSIMKSQCGRELGEYLVWNKKKADL